MLVLQARGDEWERRAAVAEAKEQFLRNRLEIKEDITHEVQNALMGHKLSEAQ